MARAGLRVGVVGATGSLGTELLELLGGASLPVREIVPIATNESLGQEIEFRGAVYPVEAESVPLTGLDLVFLCAPPAAALEFVRSALRASVPCIDLSGATAGNADVPMRIAGHGSLPAGSPLLAIPRGPALALALALEPIAAGAGLARVGATVLEGAGAAGKHGMEALYHESIAVFNQQTPPESTVFPDPIAFDCMSAAAGLDEAGLAPREAALVRDLSLLLGGEVKLGVMLVQVPIFVGLGAALAVETERALAVGEAEELLRKAPGVEVAADSDCRASTRSVAGRSSVLIGRLRVDPSAPRGLLLWLVADPLRLAASHAIELALRRIA